MQILAGLLLTFSGAVTGGAAPPAEPPPLANASLGVANGCFVESVLFCDAFIDKYGASAWCRVLHWGAQEDAEVVAGHAVAVCEVRGKLWSWDVNFGFAPLDAEPAKKESVALIAAPLIAEYPRINAFLPAYAQETPQTAMPSPPVEAGDPENPEMHDASRVATRLAAHRPVNLVQFTYPNDGKTLTGAACAFVFNGRLCVYFPSQGTVPFRTTALSVANLRQLQEIIRRIFPGAGNLKAR